MRTAWRDEDDYRCGPIPIWVGGNSDAALRRAVRLGDAWHPLHATLPWLRQGAERLKATAARAGRPVPDLAPRVVLRLTDTPVTGSERRAGEGTLGQIVEDLRELRALGAVEVLLDPFNGDPEETGRPHEAWRALAAVAASLDPSIRSENG
jgi:alkanesulfonate monooxygenase SsuD/methylene tetrahydromethanopterin reductase-like flavin-dependent oxidoreductase (luciferase family)